MNLFKTLVLIPCYCSKIYFSLKERPISPSAAGNAQIATTGISMTSLPSPLPGSDSPIPGTSQPNTNILVNNPTAGVGATVSQNNVYRQPGPQGRLTRKI